MNEHIFQLAKLADPDYTENRRLCIGEALIGSEAIEQFAKLIVRHCVDRINMFHCGSNDEWDKALRAAMEDLNDHFGI